MRWYREIRRIGLKDWFWFVVGLRRNEFHRKLDRDQFPLTHGGSMQCVQLRDRAHRVDNALEECR